jgi:hypothetical protein
MKVFYSSFTSSGDHESPSTAFGAPRSCFKGNMDFASILGSWSSGCQGISCDRLAPLSEAETNAQF